MKYRKFKKIIARHKKKPFPYVEKGINIDLINVYFTFSFLASFDLRLEALFL